MYKISEDDISMKVGLVAFYDFMDFTKLFVL